MRKPLIGFGLIALIALTQLIVSAPVPQRSLRAQLNPSYLRAMAAYKRLEPKLTREELRAITTIGILNGAKQAEEQIEEHLIEVVKDLVANTDINDQKTVVPKIARIEQQVMRDQHALEVLSTAMDLAMGKISAKEFRKEMQQALQEVRNHPESLFALDVVEEESNETVNSENIGKRIGALRKNIMTEMDIMKQMVDKKIATTLEHIIEEADENGLIAQASERVIHKRDITRSNLPEEPAEVRIINSILNEADFRNNLIEEGPEKRKDNADAFGDDFELDDLSLNKTKKVIANRSNSKSMISGRVVNNNNIADVIKSVLNNGTMNRTNRNGKPAKQEASIPGENVKPARQEDISREFLDIPPEFPDIPPDENDGGGGGGGGLVGIITSLSGGEGGSDVGALIGALTGVISTLFGPNGLDVESLISTGTSLIAGLLSGDKNFGTVLGIYVGTALDGLSGGGGAINNGKFIGNFLGTVVASLSADPEEDDAPLQPLVFAENLINSFLESKNRKGSGEESEERKETPHKHGSKEGAGGSDSGGFVKSIVSHLVSTAISVVLNASLGAVGGASKASTSLFHSSSHKSH